MIYKTPFPWFGGKSKVAHIIWERFGDVRNYVEPFFGSGAVLFLRPNPHGVETINDADGFVANFWRAAKHDPESVADHADNPVNENDLHARHAWLVEQTKELKQRLEGDPEFYDAKIAGWWVWGQSSWIGSGFCSGKGPWKRVPGDNGVMRLEKLGNAGQGVNRKRPHDLIHQIADRLGSVRVCCGDWSRVCGPSVTFKHGLTGVFLDPPYADTAARTKDLYATDSQSVAHAVREWAIENGSNPKMRIALAGYDGEHVMPKDWQVFRWKTPGGFESQSKTKHPDAMNRNRECVWFSPHCIEAKNDMPLSEAVR